MNDTVRTEAERLRDVMFGLHGLIAEVRGILAADGSINGEQLRKRLIAVYDKGRR